MKHEATIRYIDDRGDWITLVTGGATEQACVEAVAFHLTMKKDFDSNPVVSVRWTPHIDRLPMIGRAKGMLERLYKK